VTGFGAVGDAPASSPMAASILSMPKQDVYFLKVLIGEITTHRDIDSVLCEALHILGHAELSEPVRYVLHLRRALSDEHVRSRSLPPP
jgi:hypothetical protein